jgi:hypothetical protein
MSPRRRRRFAEIETPDPDTMPRPEGTPAELPEEKSAADGPVSAPTEEGTKLAAPNDDGGSVAVMARRRRARNSR